MTFAITLLAIAQTLLWASLYYLFPATLLHWEHQFEWQRSELTMAFTIAIATSALFSPIAGRILDQGKGPLLLSVCALLGGIFLLCLSLVDSLFGFYLVWFGIGVTMAGCLYEPCFAFLVHCKGNSAKKAITAITLVAGFASTICFPAAHYLVENHSLSFAVATAAATIILVATPMIYFSARYIQSHSTGTPTSVKSGPSNTESKYQFLHLPTFWLLAAGFSLLGLTHGVVISHLLPILNERSLSPEYTILIASLIGPMQVLGRIASIYADRKLNLLSMTLCCFIGIVIALFIFRFSGSNIWLLSGFVLFLGGSYGVVSIMKPMVTRSLMGAKHFGTMSGTMALPYLLCGAIAPYLGSLIWLVGGYDLVLTVMIVISLVALGTFLALWLKPQAAMSPSVSA
ncbi:MFS transporter [uncultured Vibrio sp.]|mgnify:CR=1 FL=1|uniref:MFS transporter n=1 Tax=uncultured Vibrio sp. TaxID=114054 RepID=UPI0025EBD4E7|nr:MFS transporter [uncultured Vibrio sp.]